MRLIIFCDKIPDRARRHMMREGYTKLQPGVWERICRDQNTAHEHMEALRLTLGNGSARALLITDKQAAGIRFLTSYGG